MARLNQLDQRAEAGLSNAKRGLRAPEVIEDNRNRGSADGVLNRLDDRQLRVHLDVPPAGPDARDSGLEALAGGRRIRLAAQWRG